MRRLSQPEVLAMVLKTWHDQEGPEGLSPAVRRTAWFLWLLVVIGLVGLALVCIVAWFPSGEKDCNHRSRSGANVECAQRNQVEAGREGQVGKHDAMVSGPRGHEYVHGGPA